jgi:hypothetical protein
MGYTNKDVVNHIFNSPCDVLHTFAAGLIKNCILWVVCIVINLRKCKGFEYSQGLLDSRIASFQDLPKMANMMNTYFKRGICYISGGKSKKEKDKSTGGAGGFRSTEYPTLLLQMYFAIGVKGDVIPNTPHFKLSTTCRVGNMTQIVLTAISKVMDCFFALRTSPLTEERIDIIQGKMMNMQSHYILLYQLNQKCNGRENPGLPQSRKIHAACCNVTPFMRTFGTMEKADTASCESVHRYMTVAVWVRLFKSPQMTFSKVPQNKTCQKALWLLISHQMTCCRPPTKKDLSKVPHHA